jgi:hypothetical protein
MTWLQVLSNLAVLGGLVLVALQMDQNERLMRVQLLNQYGDSMIAFETAVGGENLAVIWAKAVETLEELSLAEMRAMEAMLYPSLLGWINPLQASRICCF